jgi:phosphatidate cytidylyltransferase
MIELSPFAWTTLKLFGGVFGVLVLASAIGALLKWRVAHGQPHSVIDNLNSRVNAWWVMVAVIGLAFALRQGRRDRAVLPDLVLRAARVHQPGLHAARRPRGDRAGLLRRAAGQYFLIWIDWYGLYSIYIPVYAFLILPILATMGGDTQRFLERTSKIQWGLMVCVFCISHVPALLTLQIPGFEGRNLLLIAFLVIVVQGSDVLQYVWGKLFGKRKVAPELSPSKTWEGLIGGVASATALGAALYWATPFNPWQAALMALTICLMGFFGGLVMSAIKRDRGVKDWGSMIEGHGGMLDRLDSVIFAAPIYFHALRYWWVP